jgi:hypothetical protein
VATVPTYVLTTVLLRRRVPGSSTGGLELVLRIAGGSATPMWQLCPTTSCTTRRPRSSTSQSARADKRGLAVELLRMYSIPD